MPRTGQWRRGPAPAYNGGMKTITDIVKRFLKADGTAARRTPAAVVESVEGRVLMSGSLLTTASPSVAVAHTAPTEQFSLNYTKISYEY